MTPERNETQKQLAVFPLGMDAVQEAVYWTSAFFSVPNQKRSEMQRLEKDQFGLSFLIKEMGQIRNGIQFKDPKHQSHENGALFMINIIKNQYKNTGKIFPSLSSDITRTYFFDLINADNNSYEISLVHKNNRVSAKDPSLFPFLKELTAPVTTPQGRRLKSSFIGNSRYRLKEMMDNEQYVSEVLKNGTFTRNYGHIDGLQYGALDVYEAFNLYEERKKLNKIWNTEVK